jgi:hypothetical protein
MSVAWPVDLRPSRCEFNCRFKNNRLSSPITGSEQTLRLQDERWRCALDLTPMRKAEGRRIDALLAKIKGAGGTVDLWDFARPTPAGDNRLKGGVADVTLVGAHPAGATSLLTTGWRAITAGILLEGDYVGGGGRVYMLTDPADSDGSNRATLLISPRLKADLPDGTVITRTMPAEAFHLIDDTQPGRQVKPGLAYSYNLNFIGYP